MAKRRIEEFIGDVLEGGAQERALEFIAFLRANEIPVGESDGYWNVKLDGKTVCFILINGSADKPGPWTIWSDQEKGTWVTWAEDEVPAASENLSAAEDVKMTAWANVNFCENCGGECSPGKQKTILGKTFDGVCSSALAFTNPDAEMLNCAKKMVEMRKNDIIENGGVL